MILSTSAENASCCADLNAQIRDGKPASTRVSAEARNKNMENTRKDEFRTAGIAATINICHFKRYEPAILAHHRLHS